MSDHLRSRLDWPSPNWPILDLDGASGLVPELAAHDLAADAAGVWPHELWRVLVEFGGPVWSLPAKAGGTGMTRSSLIPNYARVAEGSLAAAFILTQHDAAVRRLLDAGARGQSIADRWLADVAANRAFVTVGLSQLTTSRRHGSRALLASPRPTGGFRLDGVMPWVTAATQADAIVTGAVLEDDSQVIVVVPTDRPGLKVREPFRLAALQASCTCEVVCDGVIVEADEILIGPLTDVTKAPGVAGTGGLETSALAIGQARAALVALANEQTSRDELSEPCDALCTEWNALAGELVQAAESIEGHLPPSEIRAKANDLALRSTQAYLTARKGTGFLLSDPAQLWARQALFFLVWSCPAPVAQTAIRQLAGLCS